MRLSFLGAVGEVTGSMYLLESGGKRVLLECGMIQGGRKSELRNHNPFPFDIGGIDAVVISHAHIDHSGRLPLLVKRGYAGEIYCQNATLELCTIMLPDSGYLNEKDAEWENKRRREKGEAFVEPLYTRLDAEDSLSRFVGVAFGQPFEPVEGFSVTFHDAGHILGSAIVDVTARDNGVTRRLVFSGDFGYRDAPVMNKPAQLRHADAVMLESTYGDRLHRSFHETIEELSDVFAAARASKGNIVIPAFTVGRTQDLLYLMAEHYDEWDIGNWSIYLDSPMAISATRVYARYRHLYGAKLFGPDHRLLELDNMHMTESTEESMQINTIQSGAIIIAGSGMCTGGRIHHHLKNNIWRPECHLVIVGYQAHGSLGRRIVDGAPEIKLWRQTYPVRAQVHTIGGLSAHGDQKDLVDWYANFVNRPPVYLVHGEEEARKALADRLRERLTAPVEIAAPGQSVNV